MLKNALNFFINYIEKLKKENFNLTQVKEEILDLLFPPVCAICGKMHKEWICEKCYRYLCKFKINNLYEDNVWYIFEYKKLVRKLILQYKFNQKAYIHRLFVTIILKDKICCRKIKDYDIIIPVPMFEKKKKQRGYNQTELIAEKICTELGITYEKKCVIKIKNTKVQSTLSAIERKENIKNAFLVNNKNKIENKKVIIFDDIYTTGETVKEISRILKQAGAKEIFILVLAKD